MGKIYLKKFAKNIFWTVYGRTIRNPPLPSHVESVLFVCLGNICRSPFAEHLADRLSGVKNQYNFSSAGINVKDHLSPPNEAIIAAKNYGVNLQDHKSRPITYSLMESCELIIAMETWQYKFLRRIFLEFQKKIILLPLLDKNYATSDEKYYMYNIKDPYGKDISDFHVCFQRIDNCLTRLFSEIKNR